MQRVFLFFVLMVGLVFPNASMGETYECVFIGHGGITKRAFTRVSSLFIELVHLNPQEAGEHFNQIAYEILLETDESLRLAGRDNLFIHEIKIDKFNGRVSAKADGLLADRPSVFKEGSCKRD